MSITIREHVSNFIRNVRGGQHPADELTDLIRVNAAVQHDGWTLSREQVRRALRDTTTVRRNGDQITVKGRRVPPR